MRGKLDPFRRVLVALRRKLTPVPGGQDSVSGESTRADDRRHIRGRSVRVASAGECARLRNHLPLRRVGHAYPLALRRPRA